MTKEELQNLCDNARKWFAEWYEKGYTKTDNNKKSDACIMVLELMDMEEYSCNYCRALSAVLDAFPEVNRDELEKELDLYI